MLRIGPGVYHARVRPLIGITADNRENTAASGRYESPLAYSRAVAEVGGLPVLLPHEPELAPAYAEACAGVLLTGGADPRTEAFGVATHPAAKPVDPRRQAFELALLDALRALPQRPALGVCLGMQMMALHAGGRLNQHLPDTLGDDAAEDHRHDRRHGLHVATDDSVLLGPGPAPLPGEFTVVSWHHQAVAEPGRLRVVAAAPDGVVEAVDDPARPFYLGVQWHPERGGEGPFNRELLARFLAACRSATG